MPDQGSVFGASDQTATTNQIPVTHTPAQGDTLGESVKLLVGEGRKYKTVEELAKAYLNVDEFVETLKGENATLRDEVKKGATLDDVLKRLKDAPSGGGDDNATKPNQSGLSAQDVAKIVRDQLTGLETQRTKQSNLIKADAAMKKLFGEKAKEVFEKEAATPEMRDAMMALASVSPDKFVALFGAGQAAATSQVDGSTSVNTAALNIQSGAGRENDPSCKEFYDALRRKEPAKYYSSTVQLQMNRAAVADRNKFFGARS